MEQLIQIVGLGLVLVCGLLLVRPAWRVPTIAFVLLALPGNVDDLMPQMTLDPHPIPFNTGPAISMIDILIVVAVLLTAVERPQGRSRRGMWLILGGLALASAVVAAIAAARGVESTAALRGVIIFARLPALLFVAWGTASHIRPALVGGAVALGAVVLLGNGVFTTVTRDLDRFTAATFGRNGLAVALVLGTVVVAGLVFQKWTQSGRSKVGPILGAVVAGAGLVGAMATGTRMMLVLLVAAAGLGFLFFPGGLRRSSLRPVAVVGAVTVAVMLSSVLLTTAGGRVLSLLSQPGVAGELLTEPDEIPGGTEVQSRGEFWRLALRMAADEPLTGVGPYQWNIERYQLDPASPVVVADAHNTYLQIAAEYGLLVLGLYLLALLVAALTVLTALRRARAAGETGRLGWATIGLAVAGLTYPIADLTNSHLFNVRTGAFGWLLLLTAIVLTHRGARHGEPLTDATLTPPRAV